MPLLFYDVLLRAFTDLQRAFPDILVLPPDRGAELLQAGVTRIGVEAALEPRVGNDPEDIAVTLVLRVYLYQPLSWSPPETGETDVDFARRSDYFHGLDLVHGIISWGHKRKLIDGAFPMVFAGYIPGTFPVTPGPSKESVHIVEFECQGGLATNHTPVLTGAVPSEPRVVYISGGQGPPPQSITITLADGERWEVWRRSNAEETE